MRSARLAWMLIAGSWLAITSTSSAQTPVVEIQINKTSTVDDDFITWAPTACQARLQGGPAGGMDVVVTLQNGAGAVGLVRFDQMVTPWPVNTTATKETLALTLPANGNWVEFMVAGKFGSPSANRDDAIIVAKDMTGAELGRRTLMVRVRKDARKLSIAERDRLLHAWQLLQSSGGYDFFTQVHGLGVDEAHFGSAFVPWHRAFVLQLERALQRIDPSVSLPYWKYNEPTSTTFAPDQLQLFSPDYMGGDPTSSSDINAIFSPGNPLSTWTIDGLAGIERGFLSGLDRKNIPSGVLTSENTVINRNSFLNFSGVGSPGLEGNPHGQAHTWVGANLSPSASTQGWIAFIDTAARDPLFFLLHCNVDRQWARWQWKKNRFGNTANDFNPTGLYGAAPPPKQRISHFMMETMWPWNGLSGDAGTPDPDDDRPVGGPPGGFPATAPFNLGPPAKPRPIDMIDYLGRNNPVLGLGFCYDDTPFQVEGEVTQLTPSTGAVPVSITVNRSTDDDEKRISVNELLQKANMNDQTAATRLELIQQISTALNFDAEGFKRQGELMNALRGMLSDKDASVRESAAALLVRRNDQATIAKVGAELREQKQTLLPTKTALNLLAGGKHPDYQDVFNKYFTESKDEATRIAAARGLAKFKDSHGQLKDVLNNKEQPSNVRYAVLQGLAANDQETFPVYATALAGDTGNSKEMKVYALAATTSKVEAAQKKNLLTSYNIPEINSKVRQLAKDSDDTAVRKQAWHMLERCDKNYLQYAPHELNQEKDPDLKNHLMQRLDKIKSGKQ